MKIDNIPDSIDPTLNLESIRAECLELAKKRAYFSAGAAIVPVPFFDVIIDVGILSQLIPEINARFPALGSLQNKSVYMTRPPNRFTGKSCASAASNFPV